MRQRARDRSSLCHVLRALASATAGVVYRLCPMTLRAHLARSYLSLDPRGLGVFRILLACVLALDLAQRAALVDVLFTDQGLLPGALVQATERTHLPFALPFLAGSALGARLVMALFGVVYLGLALGFRTRLMQLGALLAHTSLVERVAPLRYGGDVVLQLLLAFSVLLPLGRRFSLDALFGSWKERVEHVAAELAHAVRPTRTVAPVVTLGALGLGLQLCAIYGFSCANKSGRTWAEGSAVHYALHQDRYVSALGVLLREHAPPALLAFATHATLVAEALLALLIVSPLWTGRARALAAGLLIVLHLSFAACLGLGVFGWAMLLFVPLLLLGPAELDALGRAFARRRPRLRCFFDSDCGICFQAARLLARLDVFERIELCSNQDRDALPAGTGPELVEHTIVVVDLDHGRVYLRSEAIARLCLALPFGALPFAVLRAPGLRAGFERLYELVARNRRALSVSLGLAACGMPVRRLDTARAAGGQARPASAQRPLVVLRELALGLLVLALTVEVLAVNPAVPVALRPSQHAVQRAVVHWLGLYQGWTLFAPNAPTEDLMLSVHALTADGRELDPFGEVSSRHPRPQLTRIPERLGNHPLLSNYAELIAARRGEPFHPALRAWILRYPERTGDDRDRIARFTVFALRDQSPPPGRREPSHSRRAGVFFYASEPR